MARACKWYYKDTIFYKEDCDRPTVRDVILTPMVLRQRDVAQHLSRDCILTVEWHHTAGG